MRLTLSISGVIFIRNVERVANTVLGAILPIFGLFTPIFIVRSVGWCVSRVNYSSSRGFNPD